MKNRRSWLAAVLLVLLPAAAQALESVYGYPIPGPFGATILGTPAQLKPKLPEKIPAKELVLHPISGIETPDVFFYDDGLKCFFARQDKKAPLAFLIAGTGSNYKAEKLVSMMKLLYANGFHVITVASPTHPNFIVNASRSHIPGDLSDDAVDLYQVMETAWNEVKADVEVSDFYLSGYSLGGTQAAFVAKVDEEKKVFNFKKVLLINPAVSLYDSVSRIEALLDGIPGGAKKGGKFINGLIAKLVQFYRRGEFVEINGEFLYAVVKSGLVTPDDAAGVIGAAFRVASGAMIFTSDVMTNGGYVVPKNRVLKYTDNLDDYMRVSNHLSFLDYFAEYFYPYFQQKRPGLTKQALIDSESIRVIEGYLKGNPKFGAITNGNDFILSDADRAYLKELFGERTTIYPVGGHLGNLEYVDNMEYLTAFFGVAK